MGSRSAQAFGLWLALVDIWREMLKRRIVESRGSLKNIVARLKAAVSSLTGALSRDPHHAVDYASLVSLSNSSQLDAVRTMSDLSHRLKRQPSTASKLSKASSSRSSKSSRSARITKAYTSSSVSVGDGVVPSSVRSRHRKDSNHRRSRDSGGSGHRGRMQHSAQRSKGIEVGDLDRRVSMMTTSSNSTKIGELRRHEGRGGRRPAAYPPGMDRYDSSHGERKKAGWWRSMF
jgi:hypothetical protein